MQTSEKITRDDLRSMQSGETRTWQLPNAYAVDSARTTASQLTALEGVKYTVSSNYAERQITITKG